MKFLSGREEKYAACCCYYKTFALFSFVLSFVISFSSLRFRRPISRGRRTLFGISCYIHGLWIGLRNGGNRCGLPPVIKKGWDGCGVFKSWMICFLVLKVRSIRRRRARLTRTWYEHAHKNDGGYNSMQISVYDTDFWVYISHSLAD